MKRNTQRPDRNDGVPSTRIAAADLRARGFALCRVAPTTMNPDHKGWAKRSLEPDDFGPGDLLGIVRGPLSDGGRPGHALVAVDLDDQATVGMADGYLPSTGMIEGRPGKPRSHRYYLVPIESIPGWARSTAGQAVPAATKATGHPGPFKKGFDHRRHKTRVIDLIGTGGLCVCPPYAHPSGEVREWDGGGPGEPAVVVFVALWDAVCQLASACGTAIPHTAAMVHSQPRGTVTERAAQYLDKMPGRPSAGAGTSRRSPPLAR